MIKVRGYKTTMRGTTAELLSEACVVIHTLADCLGKDVGQLGADLVNTILEVERGENDIKEQ